MTQLPEDDPAVIAFEDRVMAEQVNFGLGGIGVDDFGEILILSGNGYGMGARKVLGGMCEWLVTAALRSRRT